jgi:hypothetical protein
VAVSGTVVAVGSGVDVAASNVGASTVAVGGGSVGGAAVGLGAGVEVAGAAVGVVVGIGGSVGIGCAVVVQAAKRSRDASRTAIDRYRMVLSFTLVSS